MKLRNYYVRNGRYLPYKNLKAKEVSNIKVYNLGFAMSFPPNSSSRTLNATELANLKAFLSTCDFTKDLVFFKALSGITYVVSAPGYVPSEKLPLLLVLSCGIPTSILPTTASSNNITSLRGSLPLYLTITIETGLIEKLTFDDFYKSYQSEK